MPGSPPATAGRRALGATPATAHSPRLSRPQIEGHARGANDSEMIVADMTLLKTLFNALPRTMRRRLHDRREDLRRRRPAPHSGLAQFGLAAAQVYPEGANFDDALRDGIAPQLRALAIDRSTPVASIGSCFADEIAVHL